MDIRPMLEHAALKSEGQTLAWWVKVWLEDGQVWAGGVHVSEVPPDGAFLVMTIDPPFDHPHAAYPKVSVPAAAIAKAELVGDWEGGRERWGDWDAD